MRGKRTSAWAALVLAISAATAQAEVSVRSEVDAKKVGIEDVVVLTITLEGTVSEDVSFPSLKNLRAIQGPSMSQRMSFVGGALSQSKSYTYVLQPTAVGTAEVGAVRVKTPAGEKVADAIALEVVPGSVRPRPQRRPDPIADPFGEDPFEELLGGRRARPGAEPKLFVEAQAARTRLHVGEPVVVSYYLYTQASINKVQFTEPPQYPGFWAEDLPRPDEPPSGEGATVEGQSYRRFKIAEKLLYPTKAGKLTLPPVTIDLGLPRQGFFDTGSTAVSRKTKPLSLTVDPLPDAAGFSGAVGRFRVSAQVDKPSVPLGDAVTLRFRVEGSGNLKWIDKGPEVAVAGAKVFPPQVKADLKTSAEGISGSKTWEFVVVPETTGVLEIPALRFAAFDPATGKVATTETASIPLRVEGGAGGTVTALPAPAAAGLGEGRLALRSELDLPVGRVPSVTSRGAAWTLALAALVHAAFWGAPHLRQRLRRREGKVAPPRTVKSALAELTRASQGGMSKEAAAGLIEKTLEELFGSRPDTDEGARAARTLREEVHFLRYAPQLGDYSEKVRELAGRAAELVRKWA